MLKLLPPVRAPWAWGFHPKDYSLSHAWMKNGKPNNMARNGLKFLRVDTELRERRRAEWNVPVFWPVVLLVLLLVIGSLPAWASYRRRERMAGRGSGPDSPAPRAG